MIRTVYLPMKDNYSLIYQPIPKAPCQFEGSFHSLVGNGHRRITVRIIIISLLFIISACSKNRKEDQTCWAQAAASIITENDLDQGRDVFNELVAEFGDGPGYVTDAIEFWLMAIGDDRHEMRVLDPGRNIDFDHEVYWLFQDGVKAIGFRVGPVTEIGHYYTAYRYPDIEGYDISRIVWISPKKAGVYGS